MVGILSLNDIAREAAQEHVLGKREVTETEVIKTLVTVCEPRSSKESQRPLQPVS